MSGADIQASTYIPPQIAVVLGTLLRGPRVIGHSVNFSHWFSPIEEERQSYIDGLSAVPIIFFSLFCAWAFIVVTLKCKGAEVGCASGRAFVGTSRPDEEEGSDGYSQSSEEGDNEEQLKKDDDLASTSESSNAGTISDSSVKPLRLGSEGEMIESSNTNIGNNKNSLGAKFLKCFGINKADKENEDEKDDGINHRARRTRIAFLVFASIALSCAPLCLFLTFGPLREVAKEVSMVENPDSLILQMQTNVEKVENSMEAIGLLSADAMELVNTVPTDLQTVCPLVNSSDLEAIIGVDVNEIIDAIIEQQYTLEEGIEQRLTTRQTFVDGIVDGYSTFELYGKRLESLVWIFPGLLLIIFGLTVVSIAGVIIAWKERLGSRFQRVLSYVVLPLLVIMAILFWIMVMMLSVSTMVGVDMCLSSSSNGSPDNTIEEILSIVGNETNGTAFELASTYVHNCSNPTEDIYTIKIETQEHIDNIWRQISKIDSVGRAMAIEKCGNTQEFLDMLEGARDLALTLTNIRRSLSILEDAAECENVYPIYKEAAYDIVCTQTLSASGYGFVTFLVMWICVMAMISLRASWLNNIEEEKNYHDETEVAENMVVDEHEEYLAYISRYKHEWQEYEGIEEDRAVKSSPRSEVDVYEKSPRKRSVDQDNYYGDDEGDISTMDSRSLYIEVEHQQGPPIIYQRQLTAREIMDHRDDEVSYASCEISFATLCSEIKAEDRSVCTRPKEGTVMERIKELENIDQLPALPPTRPPPPPPPMNPDFSKDKETGVHAKDLKTDSESVFDPSFDEKNFSTDSDATGEVEIQLREC